MEIVLTYIAIIWLFLIQVVAFLRAMGWAFEKKISWGWRLWIIVVWLILYSLVGIYVASPVRLMLE